MDIVTLALAKNYAKQYVGFDNMIIDSLPATGNKKYLYFVKTSDGYDEYLWSSDNTWQKIGSTEIDLTDYAKKTEIPTKTSDITNDSDFTTKTYVDNLIGDINTALNTILGEVE